MKINEISWPVYKIGHSRPLKEDGVIFYVHEKKEGPVLEIIDDLSIEGNSLATRRVKLAMQGVKLYKIRYAIFFIADLIKIASPKTWFIDSTGKFFQYTKSTFVPLIFKKISRVIKDIGCSLIEVEGSPIRYKVLYPPTAEQKYAGLLVLGKALVIYGFYEELHTTTYRKI